MGAFGLIATNTIGQGDTRASGLRPILAARAPWPEGKLTAKRVAELEARDADRSRFGGTITRAVKRLKWPGEAAVVVSVVHVLKGRAEGAELDGAPVDRISAYLVKGDYDDSPAALEENAGKAFQGSILLGMGFTFDDVAAAKGEAEPLVEMERLIARDPRNAERIKPYIGGDEVNTSPTHAHHRYAIDFENFPLRRDPSLRSWFLNEGTEACEKHRREWLRDGVVPGDYPDPVAADWPDLLEIVERRVKPERDKQNRKALRERWWQYAEKRPGLRNAIKDLSKVCVTSQISAQHCFAPIGADVMCAHRLFVFTSDEILTPAILQTRVHEVWARAFGYTLEDRNGYSSTDCFETFPFPPATRPTPPSRPSAAAT